MEDYKQKKDERIREDIVTYLMQLANSATLKVNAQKFNKWIAWLEKQGKIKRQDYPYIPGWRENRPDNKPKIKHSILMLTTHGVAEGEWLGEEWCQYRWSCKIKDTEVLYWLHLSDLETLEKENVEQGEQKSAWNEEDERKCQLSLAICDDIKGDSATYSTMYREIEELKTWLKSIKERMKGE